MKDIRLLKAEDIDVKVKQVSEKGAVVLLYKNARVDMNILDETFGAENWECDYKEIKGNLYCGIGARESEDKPFVWKWDCGIESREDEGNEKKGEASDAFKRAGFKWGIGRELYTAPFTFINVPTVYKNNKYELENKFERFKVKEIDYIARIISKLVIVDSKNNVVYDMTAKSTPQASKATITTNNPSKQQTNQDAAKNEVKPNNNEIVIGFGKYKGKTLKAIFEEDRQYIEWLAENSTTAAIKEEAANMLNAIPEVQLEPIDDDGLPF